MVVDTNVLISAALSAHGIPAALLDRLLVEAQLVFSRSTFAELESRLWKPKFDRYLSLELRRRLLHDFAASARWVEVAVELEQQAYCRDRSDDAFIHAALAGGCRWLISGDQDLLSLGSIGDLRILEPRAALREWVPE